jgi:hypothetical protein
MMVANLKSKRRSLVVGSAGGMRFSLAVFRNWRFPNPVLHFVHDGLVHWARFHDLLPANVNVGIGGGVGHTYGDAANPLDLLPDGGEGIRLLLVTLHKSSEKLPATVKSWPIEG